MDFILEHPLVADRLDAIAESLNAIGKHFADARRPNTFKFAVGEYVMCLHGHWWGTIVARYQNAPGWQNTYDIQPSEPAAGILYGELEDTLDKIGKNWQTGK